MDRDELVAFMDEYLSIGTIEDYGPQGLQVEADNDSITRLALAVDTSPAVIEAAADWQADMLLVHHGILWRDVQPIAGPFGRRVKLLLQNDLNLYSAHLALDAHPEFGNNALLASMIGLNIEEWWCPVKGTPIGVYGSLARPQSLTELTVLIDNELQTEARVLAHGPELVRKVAIISGFGADEVASARELGADTFLTGETSHSYYWSAADYGLNIIYGGHYATETVGVKAFGQHLSDKFGLDTRFFDFPTKM